MTACRVCGTAIPKAPMGAPRRYCELHRTGHHERMAAWQREHRERRLEYQRARHGNRPTLDRLCVTPDCDRGFRGFVELCPRCRQRAARQVAP